MGWKAVKQRVLSDLDGFRFQHEARRGIGTKNQLQTGEVTVTFVRGLIVSANGRNHRSSPHHSVPSIEVHTIIVKGWYIKFYFVDPNTTFISVHTEEA